MPWLGRRRAAGSDQVANYLLAIDAGSDVADKGGFIPAADAVDLFQNAAASTIVVLDACRNNPYGEFLPQGLNVSTGRSAVPLQVQEPLPFATTQAKGIFVAYSTSPNKTAVDGEGILSPFTKAFSAAVLEPGHSIQQVMNVVGKEVGNKTDWQQSPWSRSSTV